MKKVLIVNANYYDEITIRLLQEAKKVLKKNQINLSIKNVTGVFEIPIAIRKNINRFDAFVALGCVIKGKTPHFDYICRSAFDAIMIILF